MSDFKSNTVDTLVADMGTIGGPFLSRTRRQGLRLNDQGYSYYRERCRGEVVYWRCSLRRCRGRVVQKTAELSRTQTHFHEPVPDLCQDDMFIGRLGCIDLEDGGSFENNNMVVVLAHSDNDDDLSENMGDTVPEDLPTMDYPVTVDGYHAPRIKWEFGQEVGGDEEVDVKPDIVKLQRHVTCFRDAGTNTDPIAIVAENSALRMQVERLEMELRRYKDTIGRIRADLDILTSR